MIEVVTAISLWELVKHAGSWLNNLRRAKKSRQQESIAALRKVVIAARQTSSYLRKLQQTGKQSHKVEAQLSTSWTELGYALEDLKLTKLAKRCQIMGKHWADSKKLEQDYLDKADIGLERMEQLANQLLQNIQK